MKPIKLWMACLLCSAPTLTQATAPDNDDLASQQMSVRELMRLDTALALEQTRNRLRQQRGKPDQFDAGAALATRETLKLVAIYGVGKKLLAEVMIGGQSHVYMRGQPLAVGAKAGPSTYLLRGISGSCVHLERGGEGHTLCLNPALGSAK